MNELVFKGLRNAKQVITCSTQLPSFTKEKKKKERKGKNTFPIMILGIGMVELYESISHHLYS